MLYCFLQFELSCAVLIIIFFNILSQSATKVVLFLVYLYVRNGTKCKLMLQIFSDTHALVRFLDDQSTAIVPVTRIQKKECVEYNGSCKVKWSNMKTYHAFLLFSGM